MLAGDRRRNHCRLAITRVRRHERWEWAWRTRRWVWHFRFNTSLFFFFSSRRRHTRCGRDWSSDVCSSDLIGRISLVCSRGVSRKSSLILPSANSATEQASEEVSSARIRVMGKVRRLRLQDKHVGDGKRETQGPYRAPWVNTGRISRVGQRSGRGYSQRCPRL